MKYITSTVIAASSVVANLSNLNGGRKLGQTKDMLAHKLGISEEDAKQIVRSYGCYCYAFNDNKVGPHFNYNGDPVDELDHLCKKLYRSQKCIGLDNDAGLYDKECSIDNAYQWYTDENNNVVCEDPLDNKKNPNECKIAMCQLENDFTDKVVALVNGNTWTKNEDYWKWDEAEYQNNCQRIENRGNGGQELACCGTGVERKTFNTLVNQCCNNVISSFGAC